MSASAMCVRANRLLAPASYLTHGHKGGINFLAELSANKLRGAFPQVHVPNRSGTLVPCLKWLRVWGYNTAGPVREHRHTLGRVNWPRLSAFFIF